MRKNLIPRAAGMLVSMAGRSMQPDFSRARDSRQLGAGNTSSVFAAGLPNGIPVLNAVISLENQ